MKKKFISGIARTLVLLTILASPVFFGDLPKCEAQNRMAPGEFDFESLALASVLNTAREASKLPDVPQRVNLVVQAVKLLPASQHDQRLRLLDLALRDLKEWGSAEKASWYHRHTAVELRNDVLALYTKLDLEKASALLKDLQRESKSPAADTPATSLKSKDWFSKFSDSSVIADQPAKIALSLIDNEPEKALALIVQSLRGGTVSVVLLEIVQKLTESRKRPLLDKVEMVIGQSLAGNITLDPYGLSIAALLVLGDKDMTPASRDAFVSFFMRSLQAWAIAVKEPGINTSYITRAFYAFSQTVRPVISQYSPDQLIGFDLVLNQVLPLVPEEMKSVMQDLPTETILEPRDRLNDILRDSAPKKRDRRLSRLVSDLLRNNPEDFQKNLDLASDAISGLTDPDAKSAYSDLLTITRLEAFVKEKKFIEAQAVASSISSEETRAWALLALSSVATKFDQVLGFEIISNALKAVDKVSPSPHKVELALIAAAMLAKDDPERAFETLAAASKYANSSASRIGPPTKPAFAYGLNATIGDTHTRLGVYPESLAELRISPFLAVLGRTDWFRSDQIVGDIREPALRLRLKLLLAGAVLAKVPKPTQKERNPKPSARN